VLGMSESAELDALTRALGTGFRILHRSPSGSMSTHPAEIVRCRRNDGREVALLWKRGEGHEHSSGGHRRDIAYEAAVYRRVLQPLAVAPALYAAEEGDGAWLAIEYIEGGTTIDAAPEPVEALKTATRWAAWFHEANADRIAEPALAFVTRYDAAYYRGWAVRVSELAGFWHGRLPWLRELLTRFEVAAGEMVSGPLTVVHGELTPHNILVQNGCAFPVDWESAAIALGEIDVVSLTDKWPPDIVRSCESEYVQTRWPDGAPADFRRRLDLARLYWDLRWLGDRPEWTQSEKVGPRFEHLRDTAERLGLL
jgi:aminoglycoside phosphotransferase (APT) family kinase protein